MLLEVFAALVVQVWVEHGAFQESVVDLLEVLGVHELSCQGFVPRLDPFSVQVEISPQNRARDRNLCGGDVKRVRAAAPIITPPALPSHDRPPL